jgi:hypothetical protein
VLIVEGKHMTQEIQLGGIRSRNTHPAYGFEGAERTTIQAPVPRESFLSVPPAGPRPPSVWNLKVFLEISDPMNYPPTPSVNVDYGFINCRTFEETWILMEIYGKVLKTANPLALLQACVAGDLFQLISGYVPMEERRWRPLMRNFYPLGESEQGLKLSSEVGSRVDEEDSAALPSLLARLWGFIGFAS